MKEGLQITKLMGFYILYSDMEQVAASLSIDAIDASPFVKDKIAVVTTDGSTSIRSMLKAKNVRRRIAKKRVFKHNQDVYHQAKVTCFMI